METAGVERERLHVGMKFPISPGDAERPSSRRCLHPSRRQALSYEVIPVSIPSRSGFPAGLGLGHALLIGALLCARFRQEFKPPGRRVHEYRRGTKSFAVYRATGEDSGACDYHDRAQSLAPWFIEREAPKNLESPAGARFEGSPRMVQVGHVPRATHHIVGCSADPRLRRP